MDYFEIKEVTFPSLDDRYLVRILEQESHEEWQDEDPSTKLWRAVVIRSTNDEKNFFLVLSFHHLITDGVGATKVAKEILEESRHSGCKMASSSKNDVISNNELPPPLEDVVDTKPWLYHMLLPVLLDRFPALAPFLQPPHWKGLPQHQDLRRGQCKMVCVPMGDEGFVQKLRSLCQCKKLTINAFAVTILCRVVAQHIQNNMDRFGSSSNGILQNGNTVRFKIQQAASLRPAAFAEQGNDEAKDLGCYLCGPQFYVTVQLNDWKLDQEAESYQKQLEAAIPRACMDLGLCRFISEDWIEFSRKYERNIPNGRGDSIEVSNLGAVLIDPSGKWATQPSPGWTLRGLWFAQGVRSSGPVLRVSMVSGPGGMNVVLSSIPEALPQTDLEQIGRRWKEELIAAVEDLKF